MARPQWKLNKALVLAILSEDLPKARATLNAGAQPDHVIDDRGAQSKPLVLAATRAPELVALLLEFGADPNATDEAGATALHYAIAIEVCQLLTQAGADVHAKTAEGETPLHICTSDQKVQHLLDCGADPLARNHAGELPWQTTQEMLDRSIIGTMHNKIRASCERGIALLRSYSEQADLASTTQPVSMSDIEITEKAKGGRF